jgi:Calcineurin-like phosphoesterase
VPGTDVPLDRKYLKRIAGGLDAAYKRAEEQPLDVARARIAIFSDHHKGAGNNADDFRRCEQAYTAALGYYLEEGYRLFILGDSEELWEESPRPVIKRYEKLLELESAFGKSNGLERFYGNHDDLWASPRKVSGHLRDIFGPDIGVREALRLVVDRGDKPDATLFFAHGHQGTPDSDQNRWIARPVVRYIWRPLQRWLGFSMTTPARSYELRAKHDRAMYEWARTHPSRVVLVAGHTHRPVFAHSLPDPPPTRPIDQLVAELERARGAGERTLAGALHAELEFARTNQRRDVRAVELSLPCYFNTGCCSFPDGDVTGLEIADRQIRLVRWPGNLKEIGGAGGGVDPSKRILAKEQLDTLFEKVVDDPPADAKMIEHEIAPA